MTYLAGDWSSSPEVDGCIHGKIAPGKTREIMVAAFSDRKFADSYFAVAAVERHPGDFVEFPFDVGNPNIALVPIRQPIIMRSARVGPASLWIEVQGPGLEDVALGFYSDGAISLGEAVLGYRVYRRLIPPYSHPDPPWSPRRDSGWILTADTTPLGARTAFTVTCGSDYRMSLTSTLVFESGFETSYVSRLSTAIECPHCQDVPDPDQDGDGVGNACDNCVSDHNASQSDLDGDFEGDRCDLDDGEIFQFSTSKASIDWRQEAGFTSWNVYEGDLAVLRSEGLYTQLPGSNPLAQRHCGVSGSSVLNFENPNQGQVAFSLVTGILNGVEGGLGPDSEGIARPNANPCP